MALSARDLLDCLKAMTPEEQAELAQIVWALPVPTNLDVTRGLVSFGCSLDDPRITPLHLPPPTAVQMSSILFEEERG